MRIVQCLKYHSQMSISKNGYNWKCLLGLLSSSARQAIKNILDSKNTSTLEVYTIREHKVTSELYCACTHTWQVAVVTDYCIVKLLILWVSKSIYTHKILFSHICPFGYPQFEYRPLNLINTIIGVFPWVPKGHDPSFIKIHTQLYHS